MSKILRIIFVAVPLMVAGMALTGCDDDTGTTGMDMAVPKPDMVVKRD